MLIDKTTFKLILFIILCIFLGSASFLIISPVPFAFDGAFHLRFLVDFAKALDEGEGWPDWDARPYDGKGTAAFRFYAPAVYAIGYLFLKLGFSVYWAIKMTVIVYALIGAWGVIKWFDSIEMSHLRHFALILFFLNPIFTIHLNQIFLFQNICTILLLPCVLYGWNSSTVFSQIVVTSFFLGFAGFTHLPSALTIGYVLLFIAISESIVNKDLKSLFKLVIIGFLAMCLCAPYALPAIAGTDIVWFTRLKGAYPETRSDFMDDFGTIKLVRPEFEGSWTFFRMKFRVMFYCFIVIGCTSLLIEYMERKNRRVIWTYGFVGFIFLFLNLRSSLWFWNVLPGIEVVQFPWRLLWPASILLLPLSVTFFDIEGKGWLKISARLISIVCWLILLLQTIGIQFTSVPPDTMEGVFEISSYPGEYLPRTCLVSSDSPRAGEFRQIITLRGECRVISEKHKFSSSEWEIDILSETADVAIRTHWDPFWRLEDKLGREIGTKAEGKCGLIKFFIKKGKHYLRLYRTPSSLRYLGLVLCLSYFITIFLTWKYYDLITTDCVKCKK